ncbi:MAG: group I intron-associated PD-(D/E)XK endonuclease [Blastocatellia bacterium]
MRKNHTNSKGNVSESAALNAFSKAGFLISVPFGNGAPYDLVVDTGKRLLKVQVKTGRLRGGCVLFAAQRINGHHGTKRHKYAEGEIDLYAVYCQENDGIYLVPTLGALAEGRLRVSSTKNNQQQNVRWAKDFEFETFLKNL